MRHLQLLCVFGLTAVSIFAQHDHGDEETFHEVQEFFGINGTTIPRQETNLLIRHMLYRLGCHNNQGIDCAACLNTDTVLSFLNRTAENSLDEEAFHKLSVVLVVFMKDPVTECAVSDTTLGPGGRSFPQFLVSLTGGEDHLTEHVLEEVLHDMKRFHMDGSLTLTDAGNDVSGPTIDYSAVIDCVSPETILEHTGVDSSAEASEEDLEHTAAYIVTKVLQGFCLSPKGLPAASNFLSSIFSKYADNTTLSLEAFESMLKTIGIGGDDHDGGHDHEEDGHDHDEEDEHDHRQRRATENIESRRVRRAVGHDHAGEMHAAHEGEHEGEHAEPFDVTKNCYSAENLLAVFVDTNSTPSLEPETFTTLCPAIVQQLLSGVCSQTHKDDIEKTSTDAEAYGYGSIAVLIITLCTLLGAPFVSIRNVAIKRHMLAFLMSVAIGTLLGDAALHLIPEATGIHGHDHDDHDHSTGEVEIEPYVWKMTAFLASLYAFFLLEIIMSRDSHSHSHDFSNDSIPSDKEAHIEVKPKINRSLVLMICFGDALHNFADGMAVGAAFSLSVAGGISTSLAIFCHELPHELGDFAALVNGGLTIKKALVMNFVSGLTAFIGLYVGVALGDNTESRLWIFILAAGMFLYVALADLVPEVVRMFKESSGSSSIFICINIGVLLGFGIMFVIAVFESHIKV